MWCPKRRRSLGSWSETARAGRRQREELRASFQMQSGWHRQAEEKTVANQLLRNNQIVLIIFQASTVLCTLWHPDVTQRQVEEAVERLHKELETSDGS